MLEHRSAKFAAVMLGIVFLSGCAFDSRPVGPLRNQSVSLDRGKVERANVDITIAAGELDLRGGADKLLQGRFEYNVPEWEPKVSDSVTGDEADIVLKQPTGTRPGGGNTRNMGPAVE